MDVDDQAAAAMAEAMGFSSFGHASKKRKYNPHTDATTSASTSEPAFSSGANSAPLGTKPPAKVEGTDEEEASSRPASLPQRPAFASQPKDAAGRSVGGHNPLWYEGYYDPSSNANPWDRLEKKLGLESKGPWLSNDNHRVS